MFVIKTFGFRACVRVGIMHRMELHYARLDFSYR